MEGSIGHAERDGKRKPTDIPASDREQSPPG
jgi:hypothetical protein